MDWSLGKCISTPSFTDTNQTIQKKLCKGCKIKDDCLQYALDYPELTAGNVYGGMTTTEREKLATMLSSSTP